MSQFSFARGIRAVGVAAVSAAIALTGFTAPASAASSPALPDGSQTATLSIHKFEQPTPVGAEGNGTVQDTTGLTAVPNVAFLVQQVPGIDLTTNQGWVDASALTLAGAQTAVAGVTGTTVTTNASGDAIASGLPLGLYLVTEQLTPAQQAAGLSGAQPFLVTLPMTDPVNTDSWMYNVHVYPKNTKDAVTKSVTAGTSIGDPVVWTIDSTIPGGDATDQYIIKDDLDNRLDVTSADVTVSLTGTSGVSLVAGTDYAITVGPLAAASGSTQDANTVWVVFTDAGRAKLATAKAADANSQVRLVISTTVNSLGDGIIPNTAVLFPNSSYDITKPGKPGEPETPGIPSNPVEVKYGNIDIQKTDLSGNLNLAGATFQVYATEADATAGTNPISIGAVNSWTTDANGLASIQGLRYTNTGTDYWVVETKAPAGYELQTTPVRVTVNDTDTAIETTVKDAKHNAGFTLPLTGGFGTALFTAAGLGILAVVVGFVLAARRREHKTDAVA